ncbi:MAG TPA: PEGA domain-containing protein [Polyangia bacterium]
MTRLLAAVVVVTLALALGTAPRAAAADDDANRARLQEAKRRFQRANTLYRDGRYEDALHLYQAAYDLVASPDILFNLALTKEKVFDYEGCALAFRRYLDETKAGPDSQAADRLAHCRAQALIPVKVSSMPPSAAVVLDDGKASQQRGRTPTRVDLPPGRYTIAVSAPGYVTQKQDVRVEEGVHPEIDFTLEKLSTLHIEADVTGAEVQIDDHSVGVTPVGRELEAGLYRVQVTKPGYQTLTRQVRVNAGDQVSLMLSLQPLAREREVAIRLDQPLPSTVSIDGRNVGAPPLGEKLKTGTHKVVVRSPAHLDYAGEVEVPDDRDLLLTVHLTARRTRVQRAGFWSLESLASVAAAGGVVLGSLAVGDQATFDRHPSVALHDRGRTEALSCDLLFGASALVGVAGAIYYLVTWPHASRSEVTAR